MKSRRFMPSIFPEVPEASRPDVTAGRIETYLANAPGKRAHKRDIVAALKIPRTTAQTTLGSMERAHRIVRVGIGIYALPMEGVSCVPYIGLVMPPAAACDLPIQIEHLP
jgi:hypothetical protein